jgi:dTDP-4-dehydrorhamnose 3,5-epimerase
MKIKELNIPEVILIEPTVFEDERGFFFESFNEASFKKSLNLDIKFIQDNHSKSSKGVLRGLHFQTDPFAQAKLVRVVHGEIFDVAVDLRKNSKNFGKWVGEIISDKNKRQLWIPEGFAHGFITLSDSADVIYKTNNYYNKDSEQCLVWDDDVVNIDWPIHNSLILSEKDKLGKNLLELDL